MFSLICAWTNGWANNRDAGNLRRHRAHYGVIVTKIPVTLSPVQRIHLTIQNVNDGVKILRGFNYDVIKWKHLLRHWPFVRGIHRWPVNSPHKGLWRGTLIFPLICAWINGWVNNHEAGDLKCDGAHYDVTVMLPYLFIPCSIVSGRPQTRWIRRGMLWEWAPTSPTSSSRSSTWNSICLNWVGLYAYSIHSCTKPSIHSINNFTFLDEKKFL